MKEYKDGYYPYDSWDWKFGPSRPAIPDDEDDEGEGGTA